MNKNKLSHIAFILDGNKRWAKKNNQFKLDIYNKGFEKIKEIVDHSLHIGVPNLTLFTLSSENINRSSINIIYELIYKNFSKFIDELLKKKIKINIFGSRENLPSKIKKIFEKAENQTINNKSLNLNLAFNYGFKNEIKNILQNFDKYKNDIDLENVNQINNLFYLGSISDPDILIRTGGYQRLSNFIMYNLTYTELFFTKTLWPDFTTKEYDEILKKFSKITRKYGL